MDSGIVVGVDGFVDLINQFSEGTESARISKINLELIVEGFLITILPRASRGASGYSYSQIIQDLDKILGVILTAIVRMYDLRDRMFVNSRKESINHELYRMILQHTKSHNPSGE